MFIMLDGIDGSGKNTVIDTWKEYLSGKAVFDLGDYCRATDHYPEISELKSYDFIFSEEPTPLGAGKLVREELMQKNTNYPQIALAHAFSLDRLVLYKKILLPILKQEKCVIQGRGISSSLAYQPLYDQKLNYKIISQLPGNKLALENRPDYLIILDTDPKNAIKRLANRIKKDNNIFEKLSFLQKLSHAYHSQSFQKYFTRRGTKIVYLNGNAEIDIMKQEAIKILKNIINKKIC